MRFHRHQWQNLHGVAQQLLGFLLPASCALCGMTANAAVCQACREDYFKPKTPTASARCQQCALPLQQSEHTVCGHCLKKTPAFDVSICACAYAAPLDQLVLKLKFAQQLGLANFMAEVLRDALLNQPTQIELPDLLCAVPLGQRRLSERGYNQALEIAKPFSRSLGIALDARLCLRQIETSAQSALALSQRAKNIKNAFLLHPDAVGKIDGLHIGVVDDVMTSGHTLHEMAKMLKHFGAAKVSNFVFARTPPPK